MKAKFMDAAVNAINAFGNVAETVTYNQVKMGTYDRENESASDANKKYQVKAVFTSISKAHATVAEQTKGTMQVMMAAKGLAFVPDVNDFIIRNKETYEVVAVLKDSVVAVYTLMVRLT